MSDLYQSYPSNPSPCIISQYESQWGSVYREHPLNPYVSFVPTSWLVSIASRKDDLASNGLTGEMLSGHRLNESLSRDGMVHPMIISVNGVGDETKVRLDCGQHRARVAYLLAGVEWLPCFVEVSHGVSPYIRANGPHEYHIHQEALSRKPDMKAQFMRPSELFSRFDVRDIEGAEEYLGSLRPANG